jgi:hypothetical protein
LSVEIPAGVGLRFFNRRDANSAIDMKTVIGLGRKIVLAGIVVIAGALVAATFLSDRRAEHHSGSARAAALPSDFCTTSQSESRVSPGYKADSRLRVEVPVTNPTDLLGGQTYDVIQGSVVEVTVHSARPGAVAVHGLLDSCPVAAGVETRVAFRAVDTGRFPLHFHGADACHFEVAGLMVMPASAASH